MRVLVTGVTGQDGSYLAEHLLDQGHEVFGLARPQSRLTWVPRDVVVITGDLLDHTSLEHALITSKPDEIYNLAAVTAPGAGWGAEQPPLLLETTGLAVARLLEAVARVAPNAHLVHASSSAVRDRHHYGPYGVAKSLAHDAVIGYRSIGLHASNVVFFSHTSARQSNRFLARRIVRHVVTVARGGGSELRVTNAVNRRDWGWAPDYVRALPLAARVTKPRDWDVATGEKNSVHDFITTALDIFDDIADWSYVIDNTGDLYPEPTAYVEDTHALLGWRPSLTFAQLVERLVRNELEASSET